MTTAGDVVAGFIIGIFVLLFIDIVVAGIIKYDGPLLQRVQRKLRDEKQDFWMGLSDYQKWRRRAWGWTDRFRRKNDDDV